MESKRINSKLKIHFYGDGYEYEEPRGEETGRLPKHDCYVVALVEAIGVGGFDVDNYHEHHIGVGYYVDSTKTFYLRIPTFFSGELFEVKGLEQTYDNYEDYEKDPEWEERKWSMTERILSWMEIDERSALGEEKVVEVFDA